MEVRSWLLKHEAPNILIRSGWDVCSLQQEPPTLCFWYPFMNLDLVVRGPISANDWYFFCSKTLSHSDKVSLIFKASIHQIVEKIIIKPTLLSKALTSEIKFCSNPVVLNKPALIEKRGLLGSLNWYSNLKSNQITYKYNIFQLSQCFQSTIQ